jgi:acyl carrier protein
MQDLLLKINDAFTSVLEHGNFELTEATTAKDVDGWESITHMLIIAEVEKAFDIKFKLMDLMNMNNIGDLMSSIKLELLEKQNIKSNA